MSFLPVERFKYQANEWLFMRLTFGIYWLDNFHWSLRHFEQGNLPLGLARFADLNFLSLFWVKVSFMLLALSSLIAYWMQKYDQASLSVLTVLSLLVFTAEESSGVFYRVSLLTMIWFGQLLATLLFKERTRQQYQIYFSIQIIAAAYLLAAYSKWTFSGFAWVSDAQYFDLQVLKGDYFKWVTDLNPTHLLLATQKMKFVKDHLWLIQILLAFSLLLETGAFFILRSKKWALYYGICLTLMHLGIYLMMDVIIRPVAIPMIIFLLNPFYIIFHFFSKRKVLQSE